MFERGSYTGGYDADKRAFAFSLQASDDELWFQFTLDEAHAIVAGCLKTICARPADPSPSPRRRDGPDRGSSAT